MDSGATELSGGSIYKSADDESDLSNVGLSQRASRWCADPKNKKQALGLKVALTLSTIIIIISIIIAVVCAQIIIELKWTLRVQSAIASHCVPHRVHTHRECVNGHCDLHGRNENGFDFRRKDEGSYFPLGGTGDPHSRAECCRKSDEYAADGCAPRRV